MAINRQTADARTEPALSQIATGDNGQAPSLTCRIQDVDVRRRLRCSSHEGCMFKDGREGAAHLTGNEQSRQLRLTVDMGWTGGGADRQDGGQHDTNTYLSTMDRLVQ